MVTLIDIRVTLALSCVCTFRSNTIQRKDRCLADKIAMSPDDEKEPIIHDEGSQHLDNDANFTNEVTNPTYASGQVALQDSEVGSARSNDNERPQIVIAANSSASEAHKAYIARKTPHLLDEALNPPSNNRSGSLPSSPANTADPKRAANRRKQNDNKEEPPIVNSSHSPSPSEEDHEIASSSRSAAASPLHRSSAEPTVAEAQQSHHVVPRGFRGPMPIAGDAETIAPLPSLMSTTSGAMYTVVNYPMNRNGWRYSAAGPASHILPWGVFRTLETEPVGVHWSWSDRSVYTSMSADASVITAEGGFRSARANVPVREGSWYVEVHILNPEDTSIHSENGKNRAHVRLGWGRREAQLNAPVGSNGYSYGFRDISGEKVFLSRTYPYGESFGVGDVIGMWINLPSCRQPDPSDPLDPARVQRKRIPIRYKGRLYFESLEYSGTKEMDVLMDRSRRGEKLASMWGEKDALIHPNTGLLSTSPTNPEDGKQRGRKSLSHLPTSAKPKPSSDNLRLIPTLGPESQIGFFVNGKPQGIAFDHLLDFRPLRKQKSSKTSGAHKNKTSSAAKSLGDGDGEDDSTIITASSTAATILKSRENFVDDGSLGYFPFVSLYGGAKARIVTRAEDFKFPPPKDIRAALKNAHPNVVSTPVDGVTDRDTKTGSSPLTYKALHDRFQEYLEELVQYDIADEAAARNLALKRQADEDEEEQSASPGPGSVSKSANGGGGRKWRKKSNGAKGQESSSNPVLSHGNVNTEVEDARLGNPLSSRSMSPQAVKMEDGLQNDSDMMLDHPPSPVSVANTHPMEWEGENVGTLES